MKGSLSLPPQYAGEIKCCAQYAKSKEPCREWARYRATDGSKRLLCGVHSRKGKRIDMPVNPKADDVRAAIVAERLAAAAELARQRLQDVAVATRLVTAATFAGMMREYSFVPAPGHLPIFPNNKHGHGFGYGYDFSGLSPMRLGPVRHGQPSLPDALSIENYHQFNKCFPNEINAAEPCECPRSAQWAHFKPAPLFYAKRAEAYADPVPHRHKYDSAVLKKANKDYVNHRSINVPMYSVHETAAGEERHYTYLESRYFYCHAMETLIMSTRAEQWAQLQDLLARGYALQIVGYDAYTPRATDPETLYAAHYLDESRPFGHEMVILAMLCIDDAEQRPWNRYRREHAALYE